jgi:hypothetical protein
LTAPWQRAWDTSLLEAFALKQNIMKMLLSEQYCS